MDTNDTSWTTRTADWQRLQWARQRAGLKQEEMAKLVGIGRTAYVKDRRLRTCRHGPRDGERKDREGEEASHEQSEVGGGRGIRTPDTLSSTAVFKTAAINHSAIPPQGTNSM